MDFDFDDLAENEDPDDFAEAGADQIKGDIEIKGVPKVEASVAEPVNETAAGLLAKGEARAVEGILERTKLLVWASDLLRQWCESRFTAERWLDENEREWYALDRMVRSRPWAKKKDTPFQYPFRQCTNEMRKVDGPWVGDHQWRPKDTRGKVPQEVLSQVKMTTVFPPAHRLVLFAPEFGSEQSFNMDSWAKIQPDDNVDIWVVCWQGWHDFPTMIQELTLKLTSFADGTSSVWYGQGMGAVVAYEALKLIETTGMQNPNLPVALAVSDCPAPHLFAEMYKPYEAEGWSAKLSKHSAEVQGRVTGCMGMMRSYKFTHPKVQQALLIPIRAFCHSSEKLAPTNAVKEWEKYAAKGDFELHDVGTAKENKAYLSGQGYGFLPEAKLLETLTATITKYDRWITDAVLPDIGPVDNEIPTEVDCVVVGAGICGIFQAMEVAKAGKSFIVIDRYHSIGGVWEYYGNDYSRVNTSEIGYRIVDRRGVWSRPNEDHSPRRDILRDIYQIASEHCYGKIHTNTEVTKVDKKPDGTYLVTLKSVKDGKEVLVKSGAVTFHVNRRIGKRREVDWDNKEAFKGHVCYGYGNEVKGLDFWGKAVLIVGAGAFAFENVRTALEHGASHVTLLGRRDGTTCPKFIDMIAFLRPLDGNLSTNKSANMISFDCWQKCYFDAGLRTPKCWDDGLLKPNNHTISVSDLAFIAGFHGMFKLQVGEIARYSSDGKSVELKDGSKLDVDIIIKCCGFHLNDQVTQITGYSKMQPYGLLDFNLNYAAEPLLDGGQFGSGKDKTEVVVSERGFEWEEYFKGLEIFKSLGFNEKFIQPMGNPFGSGQGGPINFQSKYFAWLLNHPDQQSALLSHGGKAEQEVTELWASQIGEYSHLTLMRLIASLAKLP